MTKCPTCADTEYDVDLDETTFTAEDLAKDIRQIIRDCRKDEGAEETLSLILLHLRACKL